MNHRDGPIDSSFDDDNFLEMMFEEALETLTKELAMEVRTIFEDQQYYLKLYDYEMDSIENDFEDGDKIIQVFPILEGLVENYYKEFNATFTSHQRYRFTSHQRYRKVETGDNFSIRHIFSEFVKIFPALETKAQSFEEVFFETVESYRDAANWYRIVLQDRVQIFIRLKALFRTYKGEFLKKFENYY